MILVPQSPLRRVVCLIVASLTSLGLMVGLSGCGGLAGAFVPTAPPTVNFTANTNTIGVGQSATLTWSSTGATSVSINNNIGSVSASGSTAVSPQQTTSYVITAAGAGGTTTAQLTITVSSSPVAPITIAMSANPSTIVVGQSSVLTVTATNANQVVITDNVDSNTFTLPGTGGTQSVSPAATAVFTATATGANAQTAQATVTITVNPAPTVQTSVQHVIFMMQENRTFDSYFGMLNPYRQSQNPPLNVGDDGVIYNVDGIDDKLNDANSDDEGTSFKLFKLTSTCIDDASSAWLESYGDVNIFDFNLDRAINMNGFVHTAEGDAKSQNGAGAFTDTTGQRAMGYYDQDLLNYYYFMSSEFALSDRWFSPVSSKTVPNRIATMTGGTTQGLVNDPENDDHLGQLDITTIFQELSQANVSWKIYYSVTDGSCLVNDDDCMTSASNNFPATTFVDFSFSTNFITENPSKGPCTPPLQNSQQAVGDPSNSFCIDTTHIAPVTQFFTDLQNNTLPSFAFIEPGFGLDDEHPGSGQSILTGQTAVANILNTFMGSSSWQNSVFFFAFDEGGGPFDHVPPVPHHTNDFTDASLNVTTDISSIAVNPDAFGPCVPAGGTATLHCDLSASDPGANSGDAPAQQGFAAQLGFRLPNMVVSPFTRKHFVSHTPIDHTAIIKFVENLFIGSSANLTARDAAQPNLLEFFDFVNVPWKTPPTPPTPVAGPGNCDPTSN